MARCRRSDQQVAALPVATDVQGELRFLLITSRRTQSWIIPKGWKPRKMKARKAAAREAREEAGIIGPTFKRPLGTFQYKKKTPEGRRLCKVTVFAMTAEQQLAEWKEKGQRSLRWCSPSVAAELVRDAGLAEIIRRCEHLNAGSTYHQQCRPSTE